MDLSIACSAFTSLERSSDRNCTAENSESLLARGTIGMWRALVILYRIIPHRVVVGRTAWYGRVAVVRRRLLGDTALLSGVSGVSGASGAVGWHVGGVYARLVHIRTRISRPGVKR